MRRRVLIRIFFIFLIFLPRLVIAQIASPGVPLVLKNNLINPPEFIEIPSSALEAGRMKILEEPALKPYIFALPIDTVINIIEQGSWDEMPDGSRICRLGLSSDGAFSLNITFSMFNIPDGVNVFIYTPDLETIRGAYTKINNKISGKLATTPLPGDKIIVEIDIPSGFNGFLPELTIGRISHDNKNPFGFKTGYGKSGDCNVDINCSEGDDWQIEKRAVVKFIRGGYYICSGSLINNTANDGRAIIYTANHCIASQAQAESSVFYFNYESPSCDGGNGRLDQSISGSDLLSTTSKLDFALVELSRIPPPEYEPYFAGWNRTVGSSNDNVTCIHHPSGDVKKISKSFGTIVTGDFGSGFDSNTHWHIPQWNIGTTEGGSSGSPLFDKDHKIIGDLTGGDAGCDYNYNDYFQKFFVCWDRYPDIDQQLKAWLDPLDNGALVWNGFDPSSAGKPVANFEYKPDSPEVGKQMRFKDATQGQPAQWEWSFENGNPSKSTLEQPIIKFNKQGPVKVKLVVSNSFGKDSIQQTINVKDFRAFEADRNRIVAGARIHYKDLSTGDPISQSWYFEGGDPATWSGQNPSIEYPVPGIYDATLIIEYPELIDTLYYRDFVKVEPEKLLFIGKGMNAINKEYSSHVVELDGGNWIAGNNSLGINAFSNTFHASEDTLQVATGIRFSIGKIPPTVVGTYLTAVIWDDEFNEVIRDSVELSNNIFPDNQTVWFRHPVGIDSLIHAGFIVPENESGTFCSKIATPRSLTESGNAFARVNRQWMSLFEATGLVSDLNITLETAYMFNDYIGQIKLTPVITADRIYLDLSNLVFDKFDIQIYDLRGRQIITSYELSDMYLELQFDAPSSGIYLMRLSLDGFSFTKKIVLVKSN